MKYTMFPLCLPMTFQRTASVERLWEMPKSSAARKHEREVKRFSVTTEIAFSPYFFPPKFPCLILVIISLQKSRHTRTWPWILALLILAFTSSVILIFTHPFEHTKMEFNLMRSGVFRKKALGAQNKGLGKEGIGLAIVKGILTNENLTTNCSSRS